MKPTWEATDPPTLSPTHSTRPTVTSNSLSDTEENKVFKANYLYGAAALVVVALAGVAYFQTRASNLIKERHEVAQEIADTNY